MIVERYASRTNTKKLENIEDIDNVNKKKKK
jgi:hypothetical protein